MKNRLKTLRDALNLTQQEFADRLGVKRGTISNYELGRNEPIDAVISLICREFRVSEEWLRVGTGQMLEEVDQDQEIADFVGAVLADKPDSFRKRLISVLSTLDPDDWAVLEKIADELTNNKTDP